MSPRTPPADGRQPSPATAGSWSGTRPPRGRPRCPFPRAAAASLSPTTAGPPPSAHGTAACRCGTALLHTFTPRRERLQVCALDFGTAGTSLAIGGDDGRVRVARIPTAADGPFPDPTALGTHTAEVRAVALSPDGTTLATGGNDHRVRRSCLRPDRTPHHAPPAELSDLTGEVHTSTTRRTAVSSPPQGASTSICTTSGTTTASTLCCAITKRPSARSPAPLVTRPSQASRRAAPHTSGTC
ncbi:hypothetical protein HLK59_13520 [Streptomyces sp. S3(2020)]|nr:hypothetical protein [Streptomyces sp. S3(2020)]